MMLSRLKDYLLLLFLFLLPWQTRFIYSIENLDGRYWEYGSLSLYGTELLLGAVILLALVEKIRSKVFGNFFINLNKNRLLIVGLDLLAVLFVYLLTSPWKMVTWQYLNWVIYGFCLTGIIVGSQLSFRKISLYLWSGALLPAGLAIYQFFSQSVFASKWLGLSSQSPSQLGVAVLELGQARWLRAYGSFGWPNSLGIFLATIFLLGIILINKENGSKVKTLLLGGQIIILFGLFFTFARGAWLGLLVGLGIWFLKEKKSQYFWEQFIFYFLTLFVLFSIFSPLVFSRLDFNNRLESRSVSQRLDQWQEFKVIFGQNKFFGVGPGVYTYGLYYYHLANKFELEPIHNIYLLFIGEWGALGMILVVWGLSFVKNRVNWWFAPWVALLVAGLFDHWSLSMFSGIIFFFCILGLAFKFKAIDSQAS